jgi:hypothetical protein
MVVLVARLWGAATSSAARQALPARAPTPPTPTHHTPSAPAGNTQLLASSQAAAYRAAMGVLHQPDLSRVLALLVQQRLVECAGVQLSAGSNVLLVTGVDRRALAQ